MSKKLIVGLLTLSVILTSMFVFESIARQTKKNVQPDLMSIVRLHDSDSGDYFCSGTVISDTVVLTAGHCLSDRRQVEVRSQDIEYKSALALVYSAYSQPDLGILVGDFRDYKKSEVQSNAVDIHKAFMKRPHLMNCGFAYGSKISCFQFDQTGKDTFAYVSSDSAVFPGMSGGPVFDLETGKIVAVNLGAKESYSVFTPLVALQLIMNSKN
jgi:V8-like Glu-specific endopeptidase